jgi:hypothetical protein
VLAAPEKSGASNFKEREIMNRSKRESNKFIAAVKIAIIIVLIAAFNILTGYLLRHL